MTADAILRELSTLGSPSIKKVLMNHGAREPFYGVKISDLKPIQKRIKKNHELALCFTIRAYPMPCIWPG